MKAAATRMSRLILDVPASLPLVALQRLAEQHGCGIYRRSDGTYVFRPNGRAAR